MLAGLRSVDLAETVGWTFTSRNWESEVEVLVLIFGDAKLK